MWSNVWGEIECLHSLKIPPPQTLITKEKIKIHQFCGILTKNVQAQSNQEKTSENPNLRDIIQNNWLILSKSVKFIINMEGLRNSHRFYGLIVLYIKVFYPPGIYQIVDKFTITAGDFIYPFQ